MTYLVGSGGSILVAPDGQTTSVTITQAAGKSITVYSDTARTASVAMPDTITTNTTYYLAEDDQYTISCQVAGIEAAKLGTQVGAATLRITGNTHVSLGVDQATVDRETAGVGSAADLLLFELIHDSSFDNLSATCPVPVQGAPTYARTLTLPPSVFAAGDGAFVQATYQNPDDVTTQVRCLAYFMVSKHDGTQALEQWGPSGGIAITGAETNTVLHTNLQQAIVGSDLSYNDTTGKLTSAAGGVFTITCEFRTWVV